MRIVGKRLSFVFLQQVLGECLIEVFVMDENLQRILCIYESKEDKNLPQADAKFEMQKIFRIPWSTIR